MNVEKQSLMIASVPNIIGWLSISFARVSYSLISFFEINLTNLYTYSFIHTCIYNFVQDSSFLFMGRLMEGFGVGIISYTVIC